MNKSLSELLETGQLSGVGRIVDPATVTSDPRYRVAREAHAVWRRIGNAAIPDRRQVDPVVLGPTLLPMLVLIEVLGGGSDYRWRLFGDRHQQEYGISLTGTRLSELEDGNPSATALRPLLDQTVATAGPCFYELAYLSEALLDRYATGVFLPLTDGGPDVAMLLGAADWWRHRHPGN